MEQLAILLIVYVSSLFLSRFNIFPAGTICLFLDQNVDPHLIFFTIQYGASRKHEFIFFNNKDKLCSVKTNNRRL